MISLSAKNSNYERVEVTFNKNDELEMKLYKYLEDKTKFITKPSFFKQLLYEKMLKDESE